MKQSSKAHAVNLLTYVLIILIVFMSITTIMYYLPRKIVEPITTNTTKTTYRIGDEIRVSGRSQVFVEGREDNIVTIKCGSSSYLIRSISLPTTKTNGAPEYEFAVGVVPNGILVSPPKCHIVTKTTYHVKYFLWFERDYIVTFTSNEFDIVK